MPTDLFNGDPNFGMQSPQMTPNTQSQPRDLFQGNPNFGLNQNVPSGTFAPQQEPSITERAMVSLLHQQSPLGPTKNYDPEANNLNPLEKIGNFAVDFLPYQMGASALMKAPMLAKFASSSPMLASMLENATSGAAYGGVNDGKSGALTNGIVGAIAPVLSKPLEMGLQYGAKKLAQSSIPGLIDKATDKLRGLLDPNDYAQNLYGKFLSQFTQNKANWKDLNQAAKNIDQSITKPQISDPSFVKSTSPGQSYTAPLEYDASLNKISPVPQDIQYKKINEPSSSMQAEILPVDQTMTPKNRVISGYDASGAPIFGYMPTTKSVVNKSSVSEVPLGQYDASGASLPQKFNDLETQKITSPSSSGMAAAGQYDASGAPIMSNKVQFDASPYHNYIDSFKNKVNALEPAQQEEYKQALMLADKASEIAPQSFSGMVSSRKNINSDMKDFLKQQGIDSMNARSQEFLSGLKNTLKGDTALANKQNVGDQVFNDFTNKWEDANKSYQGLQEFYKSPQASTGVVKPIRQTREMYDNAQKTGVMDGSLIGKYVPRPSQTGTQGLDQLASNMGSKSDAQDAVKAYINRKALGNGNTTLDVAAEYGKLSPSQRDWIYGDSPEGKMLNTVNQVRQTFGKEPERTLRGLVDKAHINSALLGIPGLALGIGNYGMRQIGNRLSPESVQGLIRYAQSNPNYGRSLNFLMQGITPSSGANPQ